MRSCESEDCGGEEGQKRTCCHACAAPSVATRGDVITTALASSMSGSTVEVAAEKSSVHAAEELGSSPNVCHRRREGMQSSVGVIEREGAARAGASRAGSYGGRSGEDKCQPGVR